jgi:hypothetical protein
MSAAMAAGSMVGREETEVYIWVNRAGIVGRFSRVGEDRRLSWLRVLVERRSSALDLCSARV